ncbi:MAG: UDP-N-acetylmuramoyl-tripeptide--D-alanyl-D-alanine ligase [Clostridia bacterium]|nr:UDP-N-acetylmuramoyl-tripeptide--D-alanyl-D-alanine ligase [Clostridia bacterium]
MRTFTTEEIARATDGVASAHAEITSVVIDNREAVPGSLFIAIRGERLDGHQFGPAAVEAGAAAVMVSKEIETSVPTVTVKDTTQTFLDLAGSYRNEFDIPVVGLTGSVGKTTTKEMIWCVLNAKYHAHKTYKNWNNEIGLPKVLLGLDPSHTAAVIELGMNHKGEISRLSKTARPTVAVITNVGVSHIENLGSREGILAAKLEILDGMEPGAPLILNRDNDMLATVTETDFPITWFGIQSEDADVRAEDIAYLDSSTEFTAVTKNGKTRVALPTTGEHNVYDALAAIAAGLAVGIPLEEAGAALEQYRPAGMREHVVEKGGVTVVEDCYNASPDSMKALAETLMLKGAPGRRKIAVIADMLELGSYSEEAHRRAGKYMADAKVDLLMTYGPLSRYAAEEARENGLLRVFDFEDKEELTAKLTRMLRPGDVVAFKGSRGMKLEEVIEQVYAALEEEK